MKKEEKDEDSQKVIDIDDSKENNSKVFVRIRIVIFAIIAVIAIVVLAKYTTDEEFRELINSTILKTQVSEDSLKTIEINSDDVSTIFAYNNYIGVFSKSTLDIYNSSATKVETLTISVSIPLVETNGKYVVIAETDGSEFYVINDTNIVWQGSVDGNISKVNINENGYVTVILSNSTYTSIVVLFNSEGVELFKTYLPTTYAMCSSVSADNSYLAIGEVDYSGTVLKSNVRIMSIDSAEIIYNYSTENNNIITNMKYYDKENVVCSFTDSIISVSPTAGTEVYTITEDTCFADIEMMDSLVVLEKQSSGLFSYEYNLKFISLTSNSENLYILNNSLPQELVANKKLVALNYGNEVDIVTKNGMLKKNYTSSDQIKTVVIGDGIAGIVYKDKIEIVDL